MKNKFFGVTHTGRTTLSHAGVNIGDTLHKGMTKEELEGSQAPEGSLQYGSIFGSINDPKFQSDVTLKDITPTDEDFVSTPFRLLSATMVGAGSWKATDFSDEAVLRRSAKLLADKPVFKDHETDLDNWVGLVKTPTWTNKFKDSQGNEIPAGIDAFISVDIKTNPKVARGLLMGSIFSNSVTVEFNWEPSHTFEYEGDFWDRVGTMHEDGKMVCRKVTEIVNYHESSLVWLGADPYAKAIKENGDLTHIDVGSTFNFAKDEEKPTESEKTDLDSRKKYIIYNASNRNLLSLKATNSKLNTKIMENKFIAAFMKNFGESLGLTKEDLENDEKVEQALANLSHAKEDNTDLVQAVQAKAGEQEDLLEFVQNHDFAPKGKVVELESEIASLEDDAKLGKEYLEAQRTEAIRLYKASVDEVDENVIGLFKKADPKEVKGLVAQYTKKATEKFGGKCKDCGSTNFNFQSSQNREDEEGTTSQDVVMGRDDIYNQYRSK